MVSVVSPEVIIVALGRQARTLGEADLQWQRLLAAFIFNSKTGGLTSRERGQPHTHTWRSTQVTSGDPHKYKLRTVIRIR